MKYLIFLLLFLVSCKIKTYQHKFTFAVVYTNGQKDTITVSEKERLASVELKLKTSESGIFSNSGAFPCVVVETFSDGEKPIVCGVRSFKILSSDKTLIP